MEDNPSLGELEAAYNEMHKMTLALCALCPAGPYACCTLERCQSSADWALDSYGHKAKRGCKDDDATPYLCCSGCNLKPHMRPECTTYLCSVAFRGNLEVQRHYNDLLRHIMRLERQRMGRGCGR